MIIIDELKRKGGVDCCSVRNYGTFAENDCTPNEMDKDIYFTKSAKRENWNISLWVLQNATQYR